MIETNNLKNFIAMPPTPLNLRIAFVSSYPPRKCGIASYTKDLATCLNSLNPNHLAEIIALDDSTSIDLTYPWEVKYRINKDNWSDYQKALNYLNNSIIDIVSMQHEFSLYGGSYGKHILKFARRLKKPFTVTLHTVLDKPNPEQKMVVRELGEMARAVIVLVDSAREILSNVYNIPEEKVVSIHLGTPDFSLQENKEAKIKLSLEDKIIMLSVNLLGRNKGINHAIQAIPEVIKTFPNFIYLVVGQTHPVLLKSEGESYRRELEELVKQLRIEKNVLFINKFVSHKEFLDYLKASDFFITPYESMEQISSYSLAYAVASGKICISTPFKYAQEMLSGGAGFLTKPNDSDSIKDAIFYSLSNKEEIKRMQQKCYLRGRSMTWARVGFRHARLFDYLLGTHLESPSYPPPSLKYLLEMTTEVGLIEHTYRNVKRLNEGYATDDNARGLIAAVTYGNNRLAERYLNFLNLVYHNGMMYCDVDKHGKVMGELGLGDWFGRAFWALAFTMRFGGTQFLRNKSAKLLQKLLPSCLEVRYQRPLAHILLGMVLLKELEWEEFILEREQVIKHALDTILTGFDKHNGLNWHWSESMLTYDNPRIPMALLEISRVYDLPKTKEVGLKMLDFIIDQNFDLLRNQFRFIGNKGWLKKGGKKALFDEQPIEAGSMAQACYAGYKTTSINYYKSMAEKAFAWFHGDNIMNRPLYNTEKKSMFDGITETGISLNQGAEPILEYLITYSYLYEILEKLQKISKDHM